MARFPGQSSPVPAGSVVPNASPIGQTGSSPDDNEVQGEARATLEKFLSRVKSAITAIVSKDPRMAKIIAGAVSNGIQDGIMQAKSRMGQQGQESAGDEGVARPPLEGPGEPPQRGLRRVGPSDLFARSGSQQG